MKGEKRGIDAYRKVLNSLKGPENDGPAAKDTEAAAASAAQYAGPAKKTPAAEKKPAAKGLLKTTGENPFRKAAKFLLLIGKEEASKVLKHFSEEEAEAISREIAGISRMEKVEAEKILAEFGFLKEAGPRPRGGVETARRMLVDAFGEEKGRAILSRSVLPEPKKLFDFLEDLEPIQVFQLLKEESAAVRAIIVPYLPAEKASRFVELLGAEARKDLVIRMAKKQKINLDVLIKMEEALREKMRHLAAPASTIEMDGTSVLADILKYVDVSREEEILSHLQEEAPEVAEELKDLLFSIDVLEGIEDQALQKVLAGMDNREIALILKGKSDSIRGKILGCLSERRRDFVVDEYKILGAVLRRDVDQATRDFLDTLKRLEAEGKLVILRKSDELVE